MIKKKTKQAQVWAISYAGKSPETWRNYCSVYFMSSTIWRCSHSNTSTSVLTISLSPLEKRFTPPSSWNYNYNELYNFNKLVKLWTFQDMFPKTLWSLYVCRSLWVEFVRWVKTISRSLKLFCVLPLKSLGSTLISPSDFPHPSPLLPFGH